MKKVYKCNLKFSKIGFQTKDVKQTDTKEKVEVKLNFWMNRLKKNNA